MHSVSENEIDRQRFIQLRENEFDLQTELADLTDEILTRETRTLEVISLLRTNREHMRRLLRDAPVGASA